MDRIVSRCIGDKDIPTRIVIIEQYRDDDAFAAHLADPENETLNAKLGELTPGGSSLQFWCRSKESGAT